MAKKKEILTQGVKKQFLINPSKTIKQTDEGLQIDFIISTGVVDRDNDIIDVNGWNFDNYNKNPVILWAHNYKEPPVAKSVNIWIEGDKLKSTALFMPYDMSAFAHSIGQMYANGYLNAVSVGFDAIEAKWAPDTQSRPWGIDYAKQELLEYSCVPVPANPEALIDAKAKGVNIEPYFEWIVEALETDKIPRDVGEKIYNMLKNKQMFAVIPNNGNELLPKEGKRLLLCEKQIKLNENRRALQ